MKDPVYRIYRKYRSTQYTVGIYLDTGYLFRYWVSKRYFFKNLLSKRYLFGPKVAIPSRLDERTRTRTDYNPGGLPSLTHKPRAMLS